MIFHFVFNTKSKTGEKIHIHKSKNFERFLSKKITKKIIYRHMQKYLNKKRISNLKSSKTIFLIMIIYIYIKKKGFNLILL